MNISGSNEANRPIKRGGLGTPKTENFLPKYTTSKRLRYEKQIKTQDLFRLLSLEMLHGGRKT